MKVSDLIIEHLESLTDTVFLLSGGGIMHLVDSLRKSKLHAICCHHEQAAAIAAEGYARVKNKIGVVLVTTGPGATNAITGVAGAWLDSIPLLVISGQVKRDNLMPRGKDGIPLIRQLGFQEINIVDMIKPVTKYAVTVLKSEDIQYHLEKAVYLTTSGRPGPVWLDIPLDVQADIIEKNRLRKFSPKKIRKHRIPMDTVIEKIHRAKKPLLIAGNGVRLAGARDLLLEFLRKTEFPSVVPLYSASDLIPEDTPGFLGRQGKWGQEKANYAADNCDLLLIIGAHMQLTHTSYDYKNFASQAYKIMVDIDPNEMNKKTIGVDLPVNTDAADFLSELLKSDLHINTWEIPHIRLTAESLQGNGKYLNIYKFLETLQNLPTGSPVVTSDAMASGAPHAFMKLKENQRLISNVGLGHMGSGLPLAIGVCIGQGKKDTICFEGDGSLMLNIHELSTILYHRLPIKIFIFNNGGYFSIRNTHKRYFGKVFAADKDSGVGLPNYINLIKGWGMKYYSIGNDLELKKLKTIIATPGPLVCELWIDPAQPMPSVWEAGQYKKRIQR